MKKREYLFEKGDDALIEGLISEGLTIDEIAPKFEVTRKQLKSFCDRKMIRYGSKDRLRNSQALRQRAELGLHKSPAIIKIIELQKTTPVEDIARIVKRSKAYVSRMIVVFCRSGMESLHRERVSNILSTARRKGISIAETCALMGVSYGSYCYMCRKLGLHGKGRKPT